MIEIALIEEAEQPKGNHVVVTDFEIVDGIVEIGVVLGANHPVAYTETIRLVDKELYVTLVRLVEPVILVKHVVEEGLANLAGLHFIEVG